MADRSRKAILGPLGLLWFAIGLVLVGIVLSALGIEEAIAAAGVGLLLFVVAAWIAARPSPPRATRAQDVYPPHPIGPDPSWIELDDRLRLEASEAEQHETRPRRLR